MKIDEDSVTLSDEKKKGMSRLKLLTLLAMLVYAGLALYSGSVLPLRLIKGTSMEPALRAGDVVLLKSVPLSDVRVDDIVAYDAPDAASGVSGGSKVILHRVIKTQVSDGALVLNTKGDNSDVDPWSVRASEFRGVQSLRIPLVGKPLLFLTSPKGILFLAISALITLLYFPAMMMFHLLVLRKPELTPALALEGGELEPQSGSQVAVILAGVNRLVTEQEQVQGSLLQLSESISFYATNLQSHTEVVQDLAEVTNMLRGVVENRGMEQQRRRSLMFAVMIVDDQEPFRRRARKILEMDGDFRVVAAAGDGSEALELMERVSPDLILMDVQLPVMNGFEATKRIQDQYPGVAIALISMESEQEYSRMASEIGAMAFLNKRDFSSATLRQAIDAANVSPEPMQPNSSF